VNVLEEVYRGAAKKSIEVEEGFEHHKSLIGF